MNTTNMIEWLHTYIHGCMPIYYIYMITCLHNYMTSDYTKHECITSYTLTSYIITLMNDYIPYVHDYMAVWFLGFMNAWLNDYIKHDYMTSYTWEHWCMTVGTWLHGCMINRLHECMTKWLHQPWLHDFIYMITLMFDHIPYKHDYMAVRLHGCMNAWLYDYIKHDWLYVYMTSCTWLPAAWLHAHDFIAVWLHCCINAWLHNYITPYVHGYIAAWLQG